MTQALKREFSHFLIHAQNIASVAHTVLLKQCETVRSIHLRMLLCSMLKTLASNVIKCFLRSTHQANSICICVHATLIMLCPRVVELQNNCSIQQLVITPADQWVLMVSACNLSHELSDCASWRYALCCVTVVADRMLQLAHSLPRLRIVLPRYLQVTNNCNLQSIQ